MTRAKARILKVVNILRKVFTPIALTFILFLVASNRHRLKDTFQDIEFLTILICAMSMTLVHVLIPLVTMLLNSHKMSWLKLFYIHTNRLPARYLPGGIWQTVAKASDYNDHGMKKTQIGKITLAEIILSLTSATAIGITFLAINNDHVMIIIGVVLFISPLLMKNVLNVSTARIFLAILSYSAIWIIRGGAFTYYVHSVSGIETNSFSTLGAYLLSWVAGYLAIFAPQGIGVTEYVYCWLTKISDASIWLLIRFSFRFITLLSDMTTFLVARAYKTKHENRS